MQQKISDAARAGLNPKERKKAVKNRIKKHFFDVVYPRGGIPKGSNYCVASVMRCLYDVNQETGDLERFMPDGNTTEGHSMVSCPMFKQYVKKNFPDCIIEKPTKADKANLEEGDIILSRSSRNTSSGLHLTAVYNSREGIEISFNSEGIRPYKTENIETIIKLGKIIDTCLQERIRQMDPRSALASLEAGVKNNDFQMTTLAMAKASGRRNVSM